MFPDMIRRSVPGYDTVIPITGLLAARHLGTSGTAYDLGCSLGATTQAIIAQTSAPNIRIVGYDNSVPMIEGACAANTDPRARFEVLDIEQNLTQEHLRHAKVIILNFVLQFFEPEARLVTLKTIKEALPDDGLLIVSEKVQAANPALDRYFNAQHLAWKSANGYSALEISQKRSALENVMRIDTEATHRQRFADAGFTEIVQWYRCLNWASFLVTSNVLTDAVNT